MWHILYNIYHLISNAIIIILLQHALIMLFGKKNRSNFFTNYVLSSVLFWAIYYLPFHMNGKIQIPYFYYFLCTMAISFFWAIHFAAGSFIKKLPYILFYYSAYKCFKFILGGLYETELTMTPYIYQILDVTTWLLVVAGLYLLIKLYLKHPLNLDLKLSPVKTAFLSYYPIVVFIILQLADPSLSIPYMTFITVTSVLLLINLPIFYYIYAEIYEYYENKRELTKALGETSAQLTRYRYTILISEQAKKERHELKNKYFYIQTLLKENKLDQLDSFLTEHIGELSEDINGINTNNVLIDHILNTKLSLARTHNIKTYTEILIPAGLSINEEYFCTVLLNLLDNAIEASLKENDPDLQVYLSTRNNYLVCCIKNKVSRNVLADNPNLVTSKGDNSAHGHGVKIIRQTIKKVGGMFDVSVENNYFIATAMFPINS